MSSIDMPIPLSDIEAVMEWVDTFKLSRPNKKINRDFSDAVLLAEILAVHYPKLVEMHNYPPRNGHVLKLNNWMTLNRKVLKKLKINLSTTTMEQLAKCKPGIIERVLYMVREKIRRDEELNKASTEDAQNVSSGGSYYEACGDEQVLVVPVKVRVNGLLQTVHQKVICYEVYTNMKVELKDVKESVDTLKQKVEHLDSLLKLKDERIDELQRQLERKASRRKENESLTKLSPDISAMESFDRTRSEEIIAERPPSTKPSVKIIDPIHELPPSAIPISKTSVLVKSSLKSIHSAQSAFNKNVAREEPGFITRTEVLKQNFIEPAPSQSKTEVELKVDVVKSDVFKEAEAVQDDEYKDTESPVVTIEDTIQNEIDAIANPQEAPTENIEYQPVFNDY